MPALRMSVGLVVKPLMSGLAYIRMMPSKSAPSAKIFTRKRRTSFIAFPVSSPQACITAGRRPSNLVAAAFGAAFLCSHHPQGDGCRGGEAADGKIGRLRRPVAIAEVDEDRDAADGLAGGDIAAAVAD